MTNKNSLSPQGVHPRRTVFRVSWLEHPMGERRHHDLPTAEEAIHNARLVSKLNFVEDIMVHKVVITEKSTLVYMNYDKRPPS